MESGEWRVESGEWWVERGEGRGSWRQPGREGRVAGERVRAELRERRSGQQCATRALAGSEFWRAHKGAGRQVYGLVTGPIPLQKLQ